jgi:hypothetical protein
MKSGKTTSMGQEQLQVTLAQSYLMTSLYPCHRMRQLCRPRKRRTSTGSQSKHSSYQFSFIATGTRFGDFLPHGSNQQEHLAPDYPKESRMSLFQYEMSLKGWRISNMK